MAAGSDTDIIPLEVAGTIPAQLRERLRRTPEATAYVQFSDAEQRWVDLNWQQVAGKVSRWQQAMRADGLQRGDRVAVMLRNCIEWVLFDQAALGLGLVTVPVYTNDRADNVGYVLQDAGVRMLLIDDQEQWQSLQEIEDQLAGLTRLLSVQKISSPAPLGPEITPIDEWLADTVESSLATDESAAEGLATIVYTSGTTGRSKGVMLSHRNILWNAAAGLKSIDVYPHDCMLSFLPLSHALERMTGYYLPIMAGCRVAYARSVADLAEDLLQIRPTILVSVPRIFERIYARIQERLETGPAAARALFAMAIAVGWQRFQHQQGRARWSPALLAWPLLDRLVAGKVRARLGGRLRFAISGGAPLSAEIGRLFISLGVTILQGYGLTETSPVIAVNPLGDNIPDSVGAPLDGAEVRIGEHNELLTRSPSVMLGYWDNPQATRNTIDEDGWLHTGDQARLERGHLWITGRLKEIVVLANGEKVPPADMEMAIVLDALFEQALVIGEGRPFLAALVVPNREALAELLQRLGLKQDDPDVLGETTLKQQLLQQIQTRLHAFPGYAQIRNIVLIDEPWEIGNGLMTPTLKLRRSRIIDHHQAQIEQLYQGH